MKFKKRHIVLASMVLALSTAVFLNWQMSSTPQVEVNRELGVATYVNRNLNSSSDEIAVSAVPKEYEPAEDSEENEYFVTSRIERQKVQDEVIALAKEVLELSETSEESMEEAAEQLSMIENNILSQNRIESTLKAKGFSDCVCWLDVSSCTVIVPAGDMVDNSALIITDCVSKVADIPLTNISIVEI